MKANGNIVQPPELVQGVLLKRRSDSSAGQTSDLRLHPPEHNTAKDPTCHHVRKGDMHHGK